jgi:hypothetical protein
MIRLRRLIFDLNNSSHIHWMKPFVKYKNNEAYLEKKNKRQERKHEDDMNDHFSRVHNQFEFLLNSIDHQQEHKHICVGSFRRE